MNYISILLVVAVLVASCNEDSVELPTDGLIAHYSLDNNTFDESGRNNNGEGFNITSTTNRKNSNNKAFQFNGIDSKIVTTTEIDNFLSNGLTFSAWIYFTGETHGRILSNYNGEGNAGICNERIGFVFGITNNNQLNIFYAVDGDDYIGRMTSENTINVNEWTHVLGTWNGTFDSSGFSLYINGTKKDTQNQELGSIPCGYLESSNPFNIGIGHCSTGECWAFDGKIDDVRIYNKALDLNDIKLLSQE